MKVFAEMLDMNVRREFLQHKERSIAYSEKKIKKMRAYILSEQCTLDTQRLAKGEYFFNPPLQKERKKDNGKRKRQVYCFNINETFLLKLMTFILRDYDEMFAENLYSFRKSKKATDLINRLKKTEHIENMYILKTDVRSFGDSVDGEILIAQVSRIFARDEQFLKFLKWLLRWRTYRKNGKIMHDGPALMTGLPLASFLENIYLRELDAYFAQKQVLYGRYADDIIVYARTEAEIVEHQRSILAEMKNKKLELHAAKTMLLPPGATVEVLGMQLTGARVDISDRAIKKIKKKLRRDADKIMQLKKADGLSDEEAMRLMIIKAKRRFFGGEKSEHEMNWCRLAFPVITEIDGLKKIDAAIQNNVRYVGSGKKSAARYRIRYKKIQELGYRSLVNLYYKRYELNWSELK